MYKIFVLIFVIALSSSITGHDGHGHSHEHTPESPSFKYSKQANEKYHHEEHHHKPSTPAKIRNLETSELWLHAMGSTLLISAAPFLILFFVPLDNTDSQQPLLKILLAFASGGLLGDAFLHLIPHAAISSKGHSGGHHHQHPHEHHDDDDEHEHHSHDMSVGLWVLAGIVTFLIVEKGVRIIKGGETHHTHSHGPKDNKSDSKIKNVNEKSKNDNAENKPIKVAGYLNLAADFSHNFTDGLAIGSSYLAGNTVGIVTTITILLHEVPHEIGDFAILLQSGVSRKNAMLLQLTTALGAVVGTAISLFAQSGNGAMATEWILPFTAGGFIYIALVSVIPELLDEDKPSFTQTFLQIIAMLSGVGMMVLIAEYE